jgi:hypothetical protein
MIATDLWDQVLAADQRFTAAYERVNAIFNILVRTKRPASYIQFKSVFYILTIQGGSLGCVELLGDQIKLDRNGLKYVEIRCFSTSFDVDTCKHLMTTIRHLRSSRST